MGVPESGSLLAFSFCGFGEAGQRWLVQLKPDPLGRTGGASGNSTMNEVLDQLRSILTNFDDRNRAARRAAELIRNARGYRWVGLYDVAATEIVAIGWTGAKAPAFPRFPIDQGLNGAAVRLAQPVVVQDVSVDPRYLTTFSSTGAEAIFPVVSPSTGNVIGTIDAESDRNNAFTPDDHALLSECANTLLPLWLGWSP